ncbi:MAG: 7-cyano-7-deazaguanine synthase [Sulfuricurvum sp.]|jgi:7-cyano-7-deazaguanine synthase in queuosine biosynthesis|nr:7-cyano-7-deazaguanine synthase [Sulfuricurvum sp.]
MILLFSGGIDSFVAWHYLNKPKTVYFNLQSRYSLREISVVKKLIPTTIIDNSLNLSDREHGDNAYIPFRNLLLACQAVKYSNRIIIAGLLDDMVSDKNKEIFAEFSVLLTKLEGRTILIQSPFWYMTKEQVVRWYKENVGDDEILKTTSCYSTGLDNYCGACPSCFRKWIALRSNGYDLDFWNEEMLDSYYDRAMKGKYVTARNVAITREIDAYRSRY